MGMLLWLVLGFVGLGGGGYWLYTSDTQVRQVVHDFLSEGEFHTLEIRQSAEEIMEREKKQLLKSGDYSFLPALLKFYPYALLEVKYSINDTTKEGLMLWGLVDGELVMNTEQWQTTHGFADCIKAHASKEEFRLLNFLSKKGGQADRELVVKELRIDNEQIDRLVESCRSKKLIVQKGNLYRLHFSTPKLATLPETKIDQWLVTKPYQGRECAEKRFSLKQIEEVTYAAFENDFTIRHVTEIYLPVHVIRVQNPDGSVMTGHWNALNGRRISERVGFEPTVP